MKTQTFCSLLFTLFVGSLMAGEEGWLTSHAKALEKAKAENKLLLMDFTGSDWCGWCIRLDKEVFSQKEFKEYAEKNLVLLKLDFPRKKALAASEKKQNSELADKYSIKGYPTVIVLNAEGTQVGQLGYMQGGPAAFIAEVEKLKTKP
ncbi:MAG: thioredoxin family protein [Verrucomicrobia bacterium]|nr:thioredoxin family protein [Verrucomicrobiota bacterium]